MPKPRRKRQQSLSDYDRREILERVRFTKQCECDRHDHDHAWMTCPRPVGARAKFVYRQGVAHIPSHMNVIIVCPKCADYIRLEKGRISE